MTTVICRSGGGEAPKRSAQIARQPYRALPHPAPGENDASHPPALVGGGAKTSQSAAQPGAPALRGADRRHSGTDGGENAGERLSRSARGEHDSSATRPLTRLHGPALNPLDCRQAAGGDRAYDQDTGAGVNAPVATVRPARSARRTCYAPTTPRH